MKNKVVVWVLLLFGAVWLSTFIPSPGLGDRLTRQERMTIVACQHLKHFYLAHQLFVKDHSRAPTSKEELVADGLLLSGAVEPHRTRILTSLTFPCADAGGFTNRPAVLAKYSFSETEKFLLLEDGTVGVMEHSKFTTITNFAIHFR